ncbi:hypothetical protein SPRG_08992 [Saprolegnia parasitica CBS 223.65]|uniref:Uncharacterized protein n=1 Tax=Saprolegnia parasitica (strain CBS 223.65) TaxID=695850 RepID=A0A067C5D2_SAPPC|nr:hypothetical protein SPRG_08992 [Saprolegnia parasitica CBS 223.65]KDO25693.1 hypothetical protein SPRG_08992 [Saprolegnia parasitica CBS 223.65]|eukprot:XP_012203503.1 hypothetical protein SPRG_08992 [Saprolegnia parasitica CBS 223.65]
MGNKTSAPKYSAAEIETLKGPFSDAEFDCLDALATAAIADRAAFETLFGLGAMPDDMPILARFGGALYDAFLTLPDVDGPSTDEVTLAHVAKAAALCMRSSSASILRSLWSIFDASTTGTLSESELRQLFLAVLLMADATSDDALDVAAYVGAADAMVASFHLHANAISLPHFVSWASASWPLLHTVFGAWMAHKCFASLPSTRASYMAPRLSHRSDILSRGELIALSGQSMQLQDTWDRLYTSTQDGLSFNRLCYHLLGYAGPTLIVCTAMDGATFGAYCDTPWKDQSKFFGGPGCFLYRLCPNLLVCPSAGGTNFMYFNTKGVALPRGLGLGGTTSKCRLFFDEDLDDCYTALKCNTFAPGSLSLRSSFQIQTLEIWGCGGAASRQAQKGYRADTADLINKARKVDKAQFVSNGFDREMFLGKTFGHGTDAARIADDEQ